MILDKVPDVRRLSKAEQWELINELWQQLLPEPDHEPRPEIVALLESRMEEARKDPSLAVPWAEAKVRLRSARDE